MAPLQRGGMLQEHHWALRLGANVVVMVCMFVREEFMEKEKQGAGESGGIGQGETTGGRSWSVREVQGMLGVEEEMGFDVPFSTFTWVRWLEMQVVMVHGFARFQRAVETRETR